MPKNDKRIDEIKTVLTLIGDPFEGKEFTYKNKIYRLTTEATQEEVLSAHYIFHHFLYKQGVSGDVLFFFFKPPLFKKASEIEFLTVVQTMQYITSQETWEKYSTPYYTYVINKKTTNNRLTYYAFFLVKETLKEKLKFSGSMPHEQEVVKAVIAAARLSKSLAKAAAPIVDLATGHVLTIEPVGLQDDIFHILLTTYLRYIFSRGAARDES